MEAVREKLLVWLRDAYAFLAHVDRALKDVAHIAVDYPELVKRLAAHQVELIRHATILENCILRCGGGETAPTGPLLDPPALDLPEALASLLADKARQSATHQLITVAAELADDKATINDMAKIITEDLAMLDWLEDSIEDFVERYLMKVYAQN